MPIPGGAIEVLPSDAFDPAEAEKRIAAKRSGLEAEIERAEHKLANEKFVERAPAAVVEEERRKLEEHREALERLGAMNFRQAEEYLLSLELFGMRFGLDRMHRLMTVLGLPQRRFASIHVVGTNGKSSTVRFCAAHPRAPRAAQRELHVAAPALVPGADRGGGGARFRGRLRRRRRAAPPPRPSWSTAPPSPTTRSRSSRRSPRPPTTSWPAAAWRWP